MGIFDFLKNSIASSGRGVVSLDVARKIQSDWHNIESILSNPTPAQLKQALITADKLLDHALKDLTFGETMGERLKNFRDKTDKVTYNKMWQAHKMRNTLVHEIGFEPQHFVLKESIMDIKNILIRLGVNI